MAYDDEGFEEVSGNQPLDPNIRKQLREAEKARKELEEARAELEAQKREVNFAKAGLPDTPMANYFRKGYDGSTDVESIRAAAAEAGLLQAPTPTPTPEPSNDAELEALRRAQGATVGSSGLTPDAGQEYLAAIKNAKSVDEIMQIVNSDLGRRVGVTSSHGY